jgi:hypothetical protein
LSQAWVDYFRPRRAKTHPALATIDRTESATSTGSAPSGVWVANSFVLYMLVVLIIIQISFPSLGIGVTFQGRQIAPLTVTTTSEEGPVPVKDANGQPVTKVRQLELTTYQNGPAWDTLCLFGVWVWAGACVVRRYADTG